MDVKLFCFLKGLIREIIMTERSEKKKTNQFIEKKELLNAIAKSETGKILVRGSKARLKKN